MSLEKEEIQGGKKIMSQSPIESLRACTAMWQLDLLRLSVTQCKSVCLFTAQPPSPSGELLEFRPPPNRVLFISVSPEPSTMSRTSVDAR